MRVGKVGVAAVLGAGCLFGQYVIVPEVASAATPAVSFANAVFSGYGTGDELHLGAINNGSIQAADLEQAFAASSTASPKAGGLTKAINDSDTGTNLQPAQPSSINAYAAGTGLELGLGATTGAGTDANQVLLAGKAVSTAPPIAAPVTKSITPGAIPGLGTVGLLDSEASTLFDSTTCPLGQPISYSVGDAANSQLLVGSTVPGLGGLLGGLAGSAPVINTAGSGTSTAHSDSETYVNSNGDGTFGLATQAREIIAPVTVNLGGQLQLQLTVSGLTVNDPVTLTTVTTGEATGARATLVNNGLIGLNLIAAGQTIPIIPSTSLAQIVGSGGITINVGPNLASSLSQAVSSNPILGQIPGLSGGISTITSMLGALTSPLPNLGTITVGAPPTVNTVGGTSASADFNIAKVNLGGTGTALPASLINFELGHLQSVANDASPFTCQLPVIKTASANSVSAGHDFVYTIEVPDPAKLDLLACSLVNLGVVDTLSDNTGQPTFQVVAANDGGVINQTSANNATVTWKGLTYTVAAPGQPPNPPVTLTISVHVPSDSPSGQLLDNVVATALASGCTGGASGITNLGGVNGATLTGSYTLTQPSITAQPAAAVASTGTGGSLPVTGGEGGLWQPAAGLAALGLGGAGLGLLRRTRRRRNR